VAFSNIGVVVVLRHAVSWVASIRSRLPSIWVPSCTGPGVLSTVVVGRATGSAYAGLPTVNSLTLATHPVLVAARAHASVHDPGSPRPTLAIVTSTPLSSDAKRANFPSYAEGLGCQRPHLWRADRIATGPAIPYRPNLLGVYLAVLVAIQQMWIAFELAPGVTAPVRTLAIFLVTARLAFFLTGVGNGGDRDDESDR